MAFQQKAETENPEEDATEGGNETDDASMSTRKPVIPPRKKGKLGKKKGKMPPQFAAYLASKKKKNIAPAMTGMGGY